MQRRVIRALAAATVFASVGMVARADFTEVRPGVEPTHSAIFGTLYGGSFSETGTALTHGMNTTYSNGTVVATRLDDTFDEIWAGDSLVTVTVVARYAAQVHQAFGWNRGGVSPADYEALVYGVGSSTQFAAPPGDFLWNYRSDWGGGREWWSLASLNSDGGTDHMVTYALSGLAGIPYVGKSVWLTLIDDDRAGGSCFDQDYNDYVLEITALPNAQVVPLPGAALLGVLGLGVAGWRLRRR